MDRVPQDGAQRTKPLAAPAPWRDKRRCGAYVAVVRRRGRSWRVAHPGGASRHRRNRQLRSRGPLVTLSMSARTRRLRGRRWRADQRLVGLSPPSRTGVLSLRDARSPQRFRRPTKAVSEACESQLHLPPHPPDQRARADRGAPADQWARAGQPAPACLPASSTPRPGARRVARRRRSRCGSR